MAACGANALVEDEKSDQPKRLFNYKPFGERSPEYKEMPICDDENMKAAEYVKSGRDMMQMMMAPLSKVPMFAGAMEKNVTTKLVVEKGAISDGDVTVYMHRPKSLPEKGCAAMIFVHGGGAIQGTAEMFIPIYCASSLQYGVVGFNVDYRLAPEHGNKGGSDVYATLKYVYDNAEKLGIDKNRIGLDGNSAGVHHIFNACYLMAKKGDAGMCKMIMSDVGMFTSVLKFTPTKDLKLKEEQIGAGKMDFALKALAGDNYKEYLDNKDPMLFPDLAEDAFLKDYPPVAFFSAEFCFFNSANEKFAARLENVGKLLEFRLIRGLGHMYSMVRNKEVGEVIRDRVICVNTYLKQ